MNTAASWFDLILAHLEAADLPQVWRLLYLTRPASVSVTTARATLLIFIFAAIGRLLPATDMPDQRLSRNPQSEMIVKFIEIRNDP